MFSLTKVRKVATRPEAIDYTRRASEQVGEASTCRSLGFFCLLSLRDVAP